MLQTLLNQLYPNQCLGCDDFVQSSGALCPLCWSETPFIHSPMCNHCGVQLVGDDDPGAPHLICDDCMSELPVWERGRSVFMYTGAARRMILGLKHGDRHDLVAPLAKWALAAAADLLTSDTVFVPVPLHVLRFAKRRYNQSALIAQDMAKLSARRCVSKALIRKKYTVSLDGKTRNERFQTLKGAIRANMRRSAQIQGKNIILVDDVMTTGATLTACFQALQDLKPNRVDVLTLARVGKAS